MLKKSKSYSELITFDSYEDRLNYLLLYGQVGDATFGHQRYLNQVLYNSTEWRSLRNQIIIRDNGCDLGVEGYEIQDRILIHHINPITIDDILNRNPMVFDPENLISTVKFTHDIIHYSNLEAMKSRQPAIRTANDTCPWR